VLGIGPEDKCYALVVVTVRPDRNVTLNLAAPILFAPQSNRAMQVILENSGYSIQTPLPIVEQGEEQVAKEEQAVNSDQG
jgi:flagellar assembly factor FliW